MRVKGRSNATWKNKLCGGHGYAIGSKRSIHVSLDCNRWDCEACGKGLTKKWIDRINEDLPGAVVYAVSTEKQGKELSARIRRNINKEKNYFCIHLQDGAIVFSNAPFTDCTPKNKQKFINEIKLIMENGNVRGMSCRKQNKDKDDVPKITPWSFAVIADDIKNEYNKCKNDYEIGLLLSKYSGTGSIRNITDKGKELLRKIKSGEINEENYNFEDK